MLRSVATYVVGRTGAAGAAGAHEQDRRQVMVDHLGRNAQLGGDVPGCGQAGVASGGSGLPRILRSA